MNKGDVVLVSLFLVAVFAGIVSASVSVGTPGYSISEAYSPGQEITAWANISVANEPFNSTIEETNSGKNVSLQSILSKQSSGFGYSCVPSGCNLKYSTKGTGETSKLLKLSAGQSRTVGILVQSQSGTTISSVNKFTLNVTSTAGTSSYPQLGITMLDDGSPTWRPYKGSGVFSAPQYACYNPDAPDLSLMPITSSGYCVQFSSIPASPVLSIGASVNGSGSSKIAMSIYDASNLENSGSCNVTASGAGGQEISCTPKNDQTGGDFSISKAGSYYVCIAYPTGSTGNYQINATTSFTCGFGGTPSLRSGHAGFQIFAKWETFAPVGSFIFNDTSIQKSGNAGYNVTKNISEYLQNNYQSDCSSGCIIPITFTANQTQNVTLSNFYLDYTYGFLNPHTTVLYDVGKVPALFSTNGYQKLSLAGSNFTANGTVGNHSFDLVFNNGTHQYSLISTKYSILNVPQSITVSPLVVAALNPTKFTVAVSIPAGGSDNITSYRWNFGDGSAVQTTTSNSTEHKYGSVGVFNMTINVTNSAGFNSSKRVQISVLPPKEAVNQVLIQKLGNLKNLKDQIANFSSAFARNALTGALNLDQKTTILNNLTSANASAASSGASDEQYVNILNELNSIHMPDSVQETQQANSISFLPSQSNIDLSALKTIGGGSYDISNESAYKNAIISWDVSNITSTIDYSEFSTIIGNNSQVLLDVVRVNVGANPSGGNAYLIIPKMYNMTLGQNYLSSGNYYYVTLGNSPQTVQFATTQPLSPVNLPMFIAPSLTQISISGNQEASNNNTIDKWLILAGILGGIFFVAFIVYIILGKWYQNRYESYLFKNKNDLYNVVNYIHSAKMNGVKNSEIEKNLRRSTWTSEQISYVMKKYAGKGVGLPGFVKRVKNAKRSGRMH